MPNGRRRGTAQLRRGRTLREQRLDALDAQGWCVNGGFTSRLRTLLQAAGHGDLRQGLPGFRFAPSAYRAGIGEVRTIHFVYRAPFHLEDATVAGYLAVADVLRAAAWDYFPFVLHVDEDRMLPLNLDAHRVTPN